MKKLFILCILILLAVACGRGEDDITPDGLIQRTLTVRADISFMPVMRQARDMLNESWYERGYGYYLLIIPERHEGVQWQWDYNNEVMQPPFDLNQREMRFRTELMAGMAPDLVFNDNFPLHQFASAGFLIDFYTLIDNCNRLSRDDFFINVLRANEFRGGLYELPMMFNFHYIGINDNMPGSIIDSFAQRSYIKISDLINLYFDFLDNSDEFFYMGDFLFRFSTPPMLNIMNYIDFNTNTFRFDYSFIESFTLTNRLNERLHFPAHINRATFNVNTTEHMQSIGRTDMFYAGVLGLTDTDVFIDRGIPFSHFLPLANDYGSLVIDHGFGTVFFGSIDRPANTTPLIWMTAAADTSLAWEFIYYLMTAFSEPKGSAAYIGNFMAPWGHTSFYIPVMRSLFEDNMRATFEYLERYLRSNQRFRIENIDTVIQNAIDRIYNYTNMPMVTRTPHLPIDLIFEPMHVFSLGIITEQEALSRAENALTLWFMEQ